MFTVLVCDSGFGVSLLVLLVFFCDFCVFKLKIELYFKKCLLVLHNLHVLVGPMNRETG